MRKPVLIKEGTGFALVAAAIALAGVAVYTATGPTESTKPLRVGLYENAPKIYVDETGNAAGLFPELIERIAAGANREIAYRRCDWQECLGMLRDDEIDLMPDVASSPVRRRQFDFHNIPVTQAWSQIYAPLSAGLDRLEELQGRRVAVLEGSVQQAYLNGLADNGHPALTVAPYTSLEAAFTAVAQGDAAAVATNNFYGRRHAGAHGLVETPITFDQANLYFAAANGDSNTILAAIDDALRIWKADPDSVYYRAIGRTFASPERAVLPDWVVPALGAIVGLVLLLLALALLLQWQVRHRTRDLHDSNHRLQHLLDSSPVILYATRGTEMRPQWVSGNIEELFGINPEATGKPHWWTTCLHPEDRSMAVSEQARILKTGHLVMEYRIIDGHGRIRHIRDEKRVLAPGDEYSAPEIIGSWTDLTDSHEQKEQLHQLANFDSHTGLPNRARLQQCIEETIARAHGEGRAFSLLLLDLDRFKSVNETLGTAGGDEILLTIAQRLQRSIGSDDVVARTGGDGFCVILNRDSDEPTTREQLDGLLDTIREPITFADRTLILTASVGIISFPAYARTPEELLTGAELAMDAAKQNGGDAWRGYESGLGERTSRRLLLESDLRRAITRAEFVLHFQPQYRIASGDLAGVEALVRWHNPERGMIAPGEFIPLAEETGLIGQIDRWVIGEACRQLVRWDEAGHAVPGVAINLSARDLHEGDLIGFLEKTLASTGLEAGRLEVEITETMLMRYPERAIATLRRFNRLGVRLAMDDFGTGYSNLAHLQRLPLHRLKIDQSLVRTACDSDSNGSILRAITALGDTLGLEVIAEGIETEVERAFLLDVGCTIGQGFLFGRPAPAAELFRQTTGNSRIG